VSVVIRRSGVLLLVATLATTLAGCGLVGGQPEGYEVTAYFERGVALYEQGQVRVLGLPAGRVIDVATEESCPSASGSVPCVRVELRLDDDVDLPADVSATLIPQSLIGERYVQLTPAYTGGETLASLEDSDRVIPLERTIIPVEPDEALAAVNEFLESLDPEGLGRLIENADEALAGNGADLNAAIGGITDLVTTFAERDDELASIVDNFDAFTQVLVTREGQIGEIIESFARTANVLAQERQSLQELLASLARVSTEGFDLVAEHAVALRTDLATLGQLGQSLVANLDAVTRLLDAQPILIDGLAGAVNTELRAVNLVSSLGPIAGNLVNGLLGELGIEPICVELDTDPTTPCVLDLSPLDPLLEGVGASAPVVTDVLTPTTPIDTLLAVLGAPRAAVPAEDGGGTGDRVAAGAGSVGRFLRDAAESLAGVGG
jgi:phospholipid/cholesterol/gamma-HCH transport system substrate-binding protein